jgi:hypothetical protein
MEGRKSRRKGAWEEKQHKSEGKYCLMPMSKQKFSKVPMLPSEWSKNKSRSREKEEREKKRKAKAFIH